MEVQDIQLAIQRYSRLARMTLDMEVKRSEARVAIRKLPVGDYGSIRIVRVPETKVQAFVRKAHNRIICRR